MLALKRLSRRERSEMVEQITGGKALPAEVQNQIIERTDGVPLFVEELTNSVLESGLIRTEGDRFVLTGALPPFAIPTTLHGSLVARLDRLAPVRGGSANRRRNRARVFIRVAFGRIGREQVGAG